MEDPKELRAFPKELELNTIDEKMKLKNVALMLFSALALGCFGIEGAFSQESVPTSMPAGQENVTTSAAAQENPELNAALQQAADLLFKNSDFNGSLEKLKEICKSQPQLAPPRIILAQWLARAQMADAVRLSLDMATIETPEDPEAYLLLGEIALRQRERAAAALFFEKGATLLQKYSTNADRKRLMQISLFRTLTALAEVREDWTRMEQMIDQRIALEGKLPLLLRQKAVALFRQKRDQDSLNLLYEADKLEENAENKGMPADAIFSQLCLSRGDEDSRKQAKVFLESALKKNPNSKDVLGLSVSMRMAENDISEARQLADKLLSDDPQSVPAKRLVATIALFQKDYATAEKLFQEVVVATPSDTQSTNGLALALCEQDDKAKLQRAAEYAAENVRKENRNADFLGTLGWIFFKAGDMQRAGQALQQAAAQGNITSQTAYYLAEFLKKDGKNDQAKQILEAALKNTRPFAKRADATALLTELSK